MPIAITCIVPRGPQGSSFKKKLLSGSSFIRGKSVKEELGLCATSIGQAYTCTSIAARVHETSSPLGRQQSTHTESLSALRVGLIPKFYACINSNIPIVALAQLIIIGFITFIYGIGEEKGWIESTSFREQ